MRSYKVEGIVIKRKNLGEADRILTVFTKHRGKIQVKAKGVRKITSRRSAHTELLNLSLLSIYDNSRFPILTEIVSIDSFEGIKDNLSKVGFAYHICELIDGLCAEKQENADIFDLIKDTFKKMELTADLDGIIDDFEIKLLRMLGFMSEELVPNRQYFIEDILERKLKTRKLLPLLA